jgi:hypothetical protein
MWMRRRRDRARFERWRKATELTDEGRAAGLPVVPRFDEPAVGASRPRRPPAETDGRAYMAALSRATHIKHALGFTAASFAVAVVVTYLVSAGSVALILAGAVFVLFGLASAYIAFFIWWYVVTGELRDPPHWLLRLGAAFDRISNIKIGR